MKKSFLKKLFNIAPPPRENKCGSRRYRLFNAFTLAEVLIVLGIIGIVAEMTIPTLMNNVQNQVAVVSVKKAYSILSQAYTMAVNENGAPDTWGLSGNGTGSGATQLFSFFSPFLKINKNCGASSGCYATGKVVDLNKISWVDIDAAVNMSKVQFADGTNAAIYLDNGQCGGSFNRCGWFLIDTNGQKLPNTLGKDAFFFEVTKTGINPFGLANTANESFDINCKKDGGGSLLGEGCTAWVIYNGNLDYLKCSDLAWDGKHKCG